jgi:TetR/AcrR family transcriptional regulator, transcriptional repressor of bet genes
MPKIGMQPLRQRQLIDATLSTINDVGIQAATIAQIAKRAGVSTGIISHYFGDKSGLLEATMRDITSRLRTSVTTGLRLLPEASAEQRLSIIVAANFDETQVNPAVTKAWLDFWSSSLHHPGLHRLQIISSRRLLTALITEFKQSLPRPLARQAGYGLAALIDGLWLRSALSGEPTDQQQINAITTHYIRQYLATEPV